MWDKGYHPSLEDWKPEIEGWLGSLDNEKVKVDFEMVKINRSEQLGFASGLIKYQAVSSEGNLLRSMKNRITIGFSKFNNERKVVHQHISAPVSSENLSAILDF